MNKPILVSDNELEKLDSGVWVKADTAERSFIDYTDGKSTEEKVYAQVASAKDRSVFSSELDRAWDDWALEYHLGSKRSNIYRGLNLEHVETVLEVGCGCGAITRFLGEQGFRVDSIEGTMRRAEIARLRTEDLPNVQIISSNYHDLSLSEGSYDLVVFTGVLEYSGAYAEAGIAPEQQLEMTLRHAQAALTPQGQILIAIENRTGFKYLAGASEDHLNVPNIGLLSYPEPLSGELTRGIRTWSKSEWHEMLQRFGFGASEFCYPFPDYKVPDAIVSDHFLEHNRHPTQILGGITSRDYFTHWVPNLPETLFWKTASDVGSVDEYANSFLIVTGNDAQRANEIIDFDFVRFASVRRRPEYRMQVTKKRDEDFVRRSAQTLLLPEPDALLEQVHIKDEPFIDGQVLETVWLQSLSVVPTYDELAKHIQAYAAWLDELLVEGANEYVDALPRNIIVDDTGVWHLIDQEWQAPEGISREVILFRMLFHFALNAQDVLADIQAGSGRAVADLNEAGLELPLIQTLDDFVGWGFGLLDIDFEQQREVCLAFETGIQRQVSIEGDTVSVAAILAAPLGRWQAAKSFEFHQSPMEVRVFWTQLDKVWHLDHSAGVTLSAEHGLHASVILPEALATHRFVRIDPAATVLHAFSGWLEFMRLSVTVIRQNGEQSELYAIETAEALFQAARVKGMRLVEGNRIYLTSADANMVLDLNDLEWGEDVASVRLDLELDVAGGPLDLSARQMLREETQRAEARILLRQKILDQQQQRINIAAERLSLLEKKIEQSSTTVMGRLLGRFGLMRKHRV